MQPSDSPMQWSHGSTQHTERGYWWRYEVGLTPNAAVCTTQAHGVESEDAPRVLHLTVIFSGCYQWPFFIYAGTQPKFM